MAARIQFPSLALPSDARGPLVEAAYSDRQCRAGAVDDAIDRAKWRYPHLYRADGDPFTCSHACLGGCNRNCTRNTNPTQEQAP